MPPDELLDARRSFCTHVPVWSTGSTGERLESLVQTLAALLMDAGSSLARRITCDRSMAYFFTNRFTSTKFFLARWVCIIEVYTSFKELGALLPRAPLLESSLISPFSVRSPCGPLPLFYLSYRKEHSADIVETNHPPIAQVVERWVYMTVRPDSITIGSQRCWFESSLEDDPFLGFFCSVWFCLGVGE